VTFLQLLLKSEDEEDVARQHVYLSSVILSLKTEGSEGTAVYSMSHQHTPILHCEP